MSGMATGLTLAHLPTEDHSTLAVALVLADQADGEGGKVFPSIPFIATLARLSERQTQYVMRDLERVGFLILEKKGGGRGNPSRYRIDLEWLKAQPNRITEFREKREKNKGASRAPLKETVHGVDEKGAETMQKRCTKGAQACAPDPITQRPIYPTTPSCLVEEHQQRGEGFQISREELYQAALWEAQKAGREVGAGWKHKVWMRLENPNPLDIELLNEWKAVQKKDTAKARALEQAYLPPPQADNKPEQRLAGKTIVLPNGERIKIGKAGAKVGGAMKPLSFIQKLIDMGDADLLEEAEML